MRTKLTLRMDDRLIRVAKALARWRQCIRPPGCPDTKAAARDAHGDATSTQPRVLPPSLSTVFIAAKSLSAATHTGGYL